MSKDKVWKLLTLIAIPLVLWFVPPPTGLTAGAWHIFAIYLSAIVGLVLKPYSEPVIIVAALGASSIFLDNTKEVLSGYASTTTWIVFAAFSLSAAFVSTGLGRRIAYILIDKMGSTTLGLGYVTAFLDLIISPATPSNTARAGGIVFPIMNSVALALGSEPGKTANRAGSYLMVNTYMVTKVTSFMFLTAMAPNVLAGDFMKKIIGVSLDWVLWAKALVLPGLLMLLIVPLVVYKLVTPEIKHVDNKKIAAEGLAELGPMTVKEKALVGIFILALLGWSVPAILQQIWGIKLALAETAVAIGAMGLIFLTGVLSWDEMLKNKGGWNTLIWFGGIIGLSNVLSKAKFFEWLAKVLQANLNFGDNSLTALWVVTFVSIAVRYFFASGSAYVVAMLPVFLTVGKVAGVNPMALALALAATNSYGGSLTHYGGAAAPIIFGAGYNDTKSWWITGAVVAVICYLATMTIGVAWWKMIGLF